jgi:PAS domain S-box-containing protein
VQRVLTYALVAAAVVLAVAARWALDAWLGNDLPYVTLFGAVAYAAWLGGIRAAVPAVLLGYAAVDYFFIPPRGSIGPPDFAHNVGFAAYLVTCTFIIFFAEVTRTATARANERRELLGVTLRSIGDAVITTDTQGRVTYLNDVAETLTGWAHLEAVGQPLDSVLRIINEQSREPIENPAIRALREGVAVGLANHALLLKRDGGECPIDDSAAPIRNDDGKVSGCVLIFRDVTAQRRIEQERASQWHTARLLAAIVESSDDAIISKSLDGTIRSWNVAAERLFGHTAEQAIGKHISLIIPDERIQEEEQIIAQLRAGHRIDHFETERVRSDGQRMLVSLTISPIHDAAGAVVGASKIARDVTEQRQAEVRERQLGTEMAAANAKFQAFFEQSALLGAILDVDGGVLEPNWLFTEGSGYHLNEIVGRPVWDGPWWNALEPSRTRVREIAAEAAAGRTARGEVSYRTADGSERSAVVVIHPMTNDSGLVLFLALSGTDITDRKKAEAEREMFVRMVENSTDFIGMSDLAGAPFFVNRAGLEMIGLDSLEQARRTPVAEFFFPEDQSRIVNDFLPSVLERGHGEIDVRFRHFKTGEPRWIAYKVLTLPGSDGQPIGFATVSQDVTERRRLADDLRGLAANLSDADQKKNEFLAMLAHELRNPLAPISNAARTLRLGLDDKEAVRAAADLVERQAAQLSRLVDDLLDISRITRGRIELRTTQTTLTPIIEQAVEVVRPLARRMNHQLTVTLPPHDIVVNADVTRLAQVIGNVLNNACKFTNPGGYIALTASEQDGDAVIRIRDNGIGIAEKDLPRVFEMFAQVDASLERTRDGLGIGLTLVKTLMELHGGSVTVTSAGPGRGSEFTLRLPVTHAIRTASVPSPTTPGAVQTRHRILIVDDNLDGAESLAMLLEFEGFETAIAHSGPAALEKARHFRPDVTLLDIGLPGMNGYEVCRQLREEWGADVLIVALTGWGQPEHRARSREAGFDTHMVKPVDHDALMRLLASLPERVRLRPS